MFREQVSTVSNWFDRWSMCEQTVAMVALLRRLHPTQARFVGTILQRQLNECTELRRTEILSNDPNFVASLANTESNETLMRDLLAYLPLLNAKNVDVKPVYLALISKVLKYVSQVPVEHGTMHDDARQLLSYSLIHPAFAPEDRHLFSNLLHQFEEKVSMMNINNRDNDHNNHYPPSLSGSPPMNDFGNSWQQNNSPPSNNGGGGSLSGSPANQSVLSVSSNFVGSSNSQRYRRSNSLTPPVMHSDAWASVEELCGGPKPRSLSLSSEISPQGSLASSGSGSESHLDDPRPTFTAKGMKDIPCWLKSLRLHKYAFLFAHITFDEMMGLNEELLGQQGVTKGARHKIVLSITKLKERPSHLKNIYENMTEDKESVRNALTEIKWMLTTPIKPITKEDESIGETASAGGGPNNITTSNPNLPGPGAIGSNRFQSMEDTSAAASDGQPLNVNKDNDDDIPEKIMNVIRKACEMNPDSECEGLLVSILDKCLSHEAFTTKQKRLLALWRQQQVPAMRRNSNGHHPHFHNHHHRTSSSPGSNNNGNNKHNRHFNPRVLNLPGGIGSGNWTNTGNSIHAMFMAKRPSLQDSILESVRNSHLSVQRTKSAEYFDRHVGPLPNFFASLSSSPPMFDTLGSLGSPSDILAGLNFATDMGGGGGLSGDNDGTNPTSTGSGHQPSSALDITSRLESLLTLSSPSVNCDFNQPIETPKPTNQNHQPIANQWGLWGGKDESCPVGTFVTDMQLKVEKTEGWKDLNGMGC